MLKFEARIEKFNKYLSEFAKRVPERITDLQKAIVLTALKKIVIRTPVDTGRARGNWQVSIGQPITSVIERFEPKGNEAAIEAESAETIIAGLAAITNLPPFQPVWISNNLNYILFLENGTSEQAPRGMVAVTVRDLIHMFNENLR